MTLCTDILVLTPLLLLLESCCESTQDLGDDAMLPHNSPYKTTLLLYSESP